MNKKRPFRAFSLIMVLALALMALPIQSAQAISPDIVISQVYGGGGNSGATYTHDFIELFNRGASSVSLAGWSVQYASATGTGNFGANSGQLTELPSVLLAPGQYLLIQEASTAAVGSPLPTPDVTDATPIAMSGTAGKVALVNTTASLGCNGGSTACSASQLAMIVDLIGYGNANFFEGAAAAPALSNTTSAFRASNGCVDTDQNGNDFTAGAPNPRNTASPLNSCGGPPPTPTPIPPTPTPLPITKIHQVQGNGSTSPLVGQTVVIEGIVVGDFQDDVGTNGDLNGFHVQEEDADVDADPATSEGIFVFQGSNPAVDLNIGDLVRVEGSVSEFNGLTEITSFSGVSLLSSGNPLPTVTALSLPVTAVDDFEAYEGMYVTFPQALVISEYFNFDRFNEIVLTSERHLTPTAEFEPGSPQQMQAVQNFLLDRITLDDGRTTQNSDPAIHPNGSAFDLTNLFRGGDTVANVTGIMDYAFGLYRIQPTQGADYTSVNPRTVSPDPVGGNLTVASFNVLNYFTTLDNAGPICGPLSNQDCRGADNATEFTRQRDKIIAALAEIDADVVGLLEIENYPGDVPAADLVSGLNAVMGAGTYDYIATGAVGTDAIRVAIIYKPASVSTVGAFAVLDSSVDSRFDDTKNRPTLAQTFMDTSTGGVFTVAVNHLKSKGSACDDVGDPDTGDGSGNCNLTRKAAAEAMVDWLASDPTGSGDADFMIIGDLNSYDKEDPIDALVAGGYTDLAFYFNGEDAYSYVFDGQIGYLDYALANAGLLDEVTGVTEWHINADEADLIDYDTSFKGPNQDAIYAPDAYRSSDHDPIIVGLDVCDEIAPTFDVLTVSPDTLWPANHKYVNVSATVVVSDNFDTNPTVTLLSVTSNEPDDGDDDGNTINDVVIVDDFHFKLRAERSGVGTGRVYTITYQVTDACGNSTIAAVNVTVPLSQGN